MMQNGLFDHRYLLVMMLCGAMVLAILASFAPAAPTSQPNPPVPDPKLLPDDVVRIVVEALSSNDATDSGIRTTWKFASPANKEMTGPLERFIPMVKSPGYASMLQRSQVHYGKVEAKNDAAIQLVVLVAPDGTKSAFLFQLSRQTDGDFKGCWMTDGVSRVQLRDADPPSGLTV